jgi:hypothetical protein
MSSSIRQAVYLILCVLGVGLTWWQNLAWFADGSGGDKTLVGFWTEAFATHVSASLTLDIIVVFVAVLILIAAETKRLGMSRLWPLAFVILGNGIAAAFALPLFLFFRERRLGLRDAVEIPRSATE